jgi:hypothetical protein
MTGVLMTPVGVKGPPADGSGPRLRVQTGAPASSNAFTSLFVVAAMKIPFAPGPFAR